MVFKTYIIAIDGLGASGKSTLTKNLANKLGFEYLLTGNLYRLLALAMIEKNIDINDVDKILTAIDEINFYNYDVQSINSNQISKLASLIAIIDKVRLKLNQFQRDFANKSFKGIIVEGRDIGTIIFPKANIKFFINANLESRAKRRFNELQKKGFKVIYYDIVEELRERDERDITRSICPLKKADDAIEIDTSSMSPSAVVEYAICKIKEKSNWQI